MSCKSGLSCIRYLCRMDSSVASVKTVMLMLYISHDDFFDTDNVMFMFD